MGWSGGGNRGGGQAAWAAAQERDRVMSFDNISSLETQIRNLQGQENARNATPGSPAQGNYLSSLYGNRSPDGTLEAPDQAFLNLIGSGQLPPRVGILRGEPSDRLSRRMRFQTSDNPRLPSQRSQNPAINYPGVSQAPPGGQGGLGSKGGPGPQQANAPQVPAPAPPGGQGGSGTKGA